ncbi:MAG: tRNA (guanosine(37)-N1)-methyltransferase TrmD [Spirochaetaceae bacterium]|jgi:tRNA (guanine37-N1)-methyltransferase|nr:tRNA (guanosine(37)-N1)-methyltransferase TrmD [Spirochaetaceae bacterium]
MKFTVLSLFPEIVDAYFAHSIMARAVKRGIFEYRSINIRDYALDRHKTCDDAPYGGGAGMLLLPQPLAGALEAAGAVKKALASSDAGGGGAPSQKAPRVVCLSPSGRLFDQRLAEEFAREEELVLVCGRYEGIDERIVDLYADDEVSVGDYVLSSGEVAALAVIDAVYRLVDEVISGESLGEESFTGGLLEYPQWTRPEVFDTLKVPDVLISGHHENIRHWRLKKRVEKTVRMRPDLIERGVKAGIFDEETLALARELMQNVGKE